MATITSTQSGLASAGSTWVGGNPPVTGDIIVIASGHIVHWDVGLTTAGAGVLLGSNAGAVGHAVTINGASSVSFGTLIVDSGATLYLRGFDTTTNTLMLVNRFGQFNPASGSTVTGDVAADFGSIILNKGQINLNGALSTVPAANINWASQITNEASSGGGPYDLATNVYCAGLVNEWTANSGGTGLGSFGDTSLSFGSQSPASILATEVASLALVNAVGKYFVDYDAAEIFFYTTATANTFTATYKFLTGVSWKGWGYDSTQATSFNSFVSTGSTFQYMGGTNTGSEHPAIKVKSMLTAGANGAATDRLFKFTGNTVKYCYQGLDIIGCTGTAGDYLLCESNNWFTCRGASSVGWCVFSFRNKNTFLSLSLNALNSRNNFYYVQEFVASLQQHSSIKVNGNTGRVGQLFGAGLPAVFPDGMMQNNVIDGYGQALNSNAISEACGTSGHPFVMSGNTFSHFIRGVNCQQYLTIDSNWFKETYHHGIIQSTFDDIYVTNITVTNNLVTNTGVTTQFQASPFVETGYNHRHWIDHMTVANNTVINALRGVVGFGDSQDNGGNSTTTNAAFINNIAYNAVSGGGTGGQQGVNRPANTSTEVTRVHIVELDYGLYFNVTNQYAGCTSTKGYSFLSGGVNYNTIAGPTRNLPGLALQFPSYTTTQSGCSVVYTVTTPGVTETLAWNDGGGAGTAVSIVFGNSTTTSVSTATTTNGYTTGTKLNDTGQTWSTTLNNAACPRGHILKMTSGAASGQVGVITNNTATQLTSVPPFTVLPASGDSYTIYKQEIRCNNSGATQSVGIGLDPNLFPFGTAGTDTGISLAFHDAGNTDPLLVNASGTTAASFKLSPSSPAVNAASGIGAPALDYFGTARPQGTLFDIGFHELLLATTYTLTGPSSGPIGTASTNFTVSPNGKIVSAVITPSDSGGGGTFTPASLTFTNSSAAQTFTYTPSSAGTKTISATNNGGLTDPGSLTYTATAAGGGSGGRNLTLLGVG